MLSDLLKVALWAVLSTLLTITSTFAHEARPAIADIEIGQNIVAIELQLTTEAILSGADLSLDSDDIPEDAIATYDSLRALNDDEIAARMTAHWEDFQHSVSAAAGESISLNLQMVTVIPEPEQALPRDTVLTLTGALPAGDAPVVFGWVRENGPLIVRQNDGDETPYAEFLRNGDLSAPMPRTGVAEVGAIRAFYDYMIIGYEHILPKGLDHILFVLGLFFFALKRRALLLQVTAFTLAHTVTLALGILGWIAAPAHIVEPLIAASIVFIAIENIRGGAISPARIAVVFAFGLLHGLGFALVLGEIGLTPARFVSNLIAFNIGVELGQISVLIFAYAAVGYWFGDKPWYRARIAIPASMFIGLVGAYWTVERVFF